MKKSLILATSFAMALGVGVAVGAHHMKEVTKKVDATGNKVYLKPGVWDTASANFDVWHWKTGEDGAWEVMSAVSTDTGVYEATIPVTSNNVIFARMNPSADEPSWPSVWNQSNDLTYSTATPCYTISGWGDGKSPGSWGTYTPPAAASTYYYSLNGAADVEMTPSGNEVISASLSFKVGDELTFKKDSAAYAVTAKDDDAYTKVELVDNKLVFVQDYTGVLYLNTSSAKLWAGELDRGYYLNGSFSPEWNVKHALKASEKEGEEGTFEIKGLTVADNAEVKFMQFVNNQKEPNYVNIDGEKLTIGGGIDAGLTGGNNLKFNKGGTYDFYLNTTNNNWLTVNDPSYVPPEPDDPAEDGYYLVGTKTNWKYAGATKLAAGENGNRAQLINYSATAGEQFKVRSRLETVDTWYGWGDSHDQNYVVGESDKQLDVYVNGDGYLWVQEHVEPDEPENDGYYLASSKSDLKFAGATAMSMSDLSDGNCAELFNYSAAKDEVIQVRGFFDGEDPEKKEGVYGGSAIQGVGAAGEDGTFVMSAENAIDVFAKWEESTLKYYITKHADRYNVTFNGYFYEGKKLEKPMEVVDTQRATEDVVFNVDEEALAKAGYVLRGVYTDNTFEHEYTATKLAGATELFVKYTKVGFYAIPGTTRNVDLGTMMITEEIAVTNKAEISLSVEANDCYSFVEYKADGTMEGQSGLGDNVPATLATYVEDANGGHVKFEKTTSVAVYFSSGDNKIYLNEGLAAFLSSFLSDVGSVCSTFEGPGYEEEAYIASLQAAWGRQKVAFNALSDEEQKVIKDAGYGAKEGDDDLSKMINKYYYIVEKYGTDVCEDFVWKVTRAPKVGNNVMFLNNSNNTGLIIIISVSAISVISFAALLMLKKKKRK